MSDPVNIALVGLGTVGSGVARILLQHAERTARRAGRSIRIRHAVVRDLDKPRDVQLDSALLTTDVQTVINDPETHVVIELMGGLHPAGEIMAACLRNGKDVVTANKALLCEQGTELFQLAREHGRTIAFEAAIAGGIPIVTTVAQAMSANQITGIEAILNGTSNFILTEMRSQNRSYADALAQAQALGYAEADPTMDVDGTDAAQKLVLLVQLAFGMHVPLTAFPRQGIDAVQLADLHYAGELGYTIKLLAVAKLVDGQLEMHVQPTLVRHDRPLAQTDGAFNMIALDGDAVGRTWYAGSGAGQMPTASAVVADLIDTVAGRTRSTFELLSVFNDQPPIPVQASDEIRSRYYMRFNVLDRPHVFADLADILGRHGISLASIIQHDAGEPAEEPAATSAEETVVQVIVMTHRTTRGRIRAAEAELSQLSTVTPAWVWLPVAD